VLAKRELKLPVREKAIRRIINMKTILKTIAVSLLLIVVGADGSVAWAAKSKKPATTCPSLVGASEIKGTHVKNLQNQDLGQIDEVLIDPDTGQVRFVILEVGGFLGSGATRVAVPLSAFQITQEGNTSKWVLDADKEKLKNAPKVEGKNYQRLYTRAEAEPIFVYWRIKWLEPESSSNP
jgi:PRC-barrel domain